MHRDEVFKPTNTGRLIADVMPDSTHAFQWSRTQPPVQLLAMLRDPRRVCAIAYPARKGANKATLAGVPKDLGERIFTIILLDGTWRQAGRMYRMSRYLDSTPLINVPMPTSEYAVRQAPMAGQLATAEAAVALLSACQEHSAAAHLSQYFGAFNRAYVSLRGR